MILTFLNILKSIYGRLKVSFQRAFQSPEIGRGLRKEVRKFTNFYTLTNVYSSS
jgi:hypothetical protein